jgi:hypothetical protein
MMVKVVDVVVSVCFLFIVVCLDDEVVLFFAFSDGQFYFPA